MIVEGVTDRAVVEKIAEICNVNPEVKLMRGNNPKKAIRVIKAMLNIHRLSKAIILKDQNNFPLEAIKNKFSKELNFDFPTFVVIAKKAIEAWILAGMGISNAENIDEPVDYLNNFLLKEGKQYVKNYEAVKNLMGRWDMNNASKDAISLKEFITKLKDP